MGHGAVHDSTQRAREARKRAEKGLQSPLESPRRPDAYRAPHHQAQVEAGRVNQQAFQDVCVTPEVGASHAAGFVQVRERALDQLASHPL